MKKQHEAIPFRSNSINALRDALLRRSMSNATEVFARKRAEAVADSPFEEWRQQASEMRSDVLASLSAYVDRFARNATKAGAIVYRVGDAQSARELIAHILKDRQVRNVVKSKSMVTEEIGLNHHLEAKGFNVVETDLGEYIIQIAGEHPSHIIVPAIHKDRRQVGRLFAEKLGLEYSEDPGLLTKMARNILRKQFLSADAGISGANFAIADSGSLVLFTNEGNGRMVTTVPPLHVAVLSIEKIIPSIADLPLLIRLLPRSATGQIITSYLSVITGTRKNGETCGAKELHIVLLDNGRSGILRSEFREMLKCIRCGACLNACPVYRAIGGHSYGSTYPGPMGIVLTNLLDGMATSHPLLDATTLCGACADVCPVKVPLPSLLRRLREIRAQKGLTPMPERTAMRVFGIATQFPSIFRVLQSVARTSWPIAGYLKATSRLPRPSEKNFRGRFLS